MKRGSAWLWFAAGSLFGAATVMKQSGASFIVFGAVCALAAPELAPDPAIPSGRRWRGVVCYLAGAAAPIAALFAWLGAAGVWRRFWFWTVQYASEYGSEIPASQAHVTFLKEFPGVIRWCPGLWIAAALGLLVLVFSRRLRGREKAFVLLFTLFSFASVCLGFYFRPHYFVTLVPAVSLLAAILAGGGESHRNDPIRRPSTRRRRKLADLRVLVGCVVLTVALGHGIAGQWRYLFRDDTESLCRSFYPLHPYLEAREAADFVARGTTPSERIAVLGSEPEIYFYARRTSATGYIYTCSLFENQKYARRMQEELRREVRDSAPRFIIKSSEFNISSAAYGDNDIRGYMDAYLRDNYVLVGAAALSLDLTKPPTWLWYADASRCLDGLYSLCIYQRK